MTGLNETGIDKSELETESSKKEKGTGSDIEWKKVMEVNGSEKDGKSNKRESVDTEGKKKRYCKWDEGKREKKTTKAVEMEKIREREMIMPALLSV